MDTSLNYIRAPPEELGPERRIHDQYRSQRHGRRMRDPLVYVGLRLLVLNLFSKLMLVIVPATDHLPWSHESLPICPSTGLITLVFHTCP